MEYVGKEKRPVKRLEGRTDCLRLFFECTGSLGDARKIRLGKDFRLAQVLKLFAPFEVGQLADRKEEFDRAFDAAKRAARKGLRP